MGQVKTVFNPQHHKAIASLLSRNIPSVTDDPNGHIKMLMWEQIRYEFVLLFSEDSPKFDKDDFITTCSQFKLFKGDKSCDYY